MEHNQKNDLRDKSVFFANAKGEALPLSVEEALAQGRTHFLGWYCAVGIENIHITADGEIYGGACRNNGHLGNVYEHSFFLKKEWHRCTTSMCHCGADLQIRKVKDPQYIPQTFQEMPSRRATTMDDAVFVAPVHQEMHRKHPLSLTWDLGRRCNYSCSYCNDIISNNYEAHRTEGSLRHAWRGLQKHFLKEKKAKIVFTGGEPTTNPFYLDFVKMIRQEGHYLHTTTNGSRRPEYYSDLLEHSFIGFSYHMEFAQLDHFQKVVQALIEKKQQNQQAADNWCGIRIMVPPGRFDEARQIYQALKKLPGFQQVGLMIFMSPCYRKEDHSALMPYLPQELEQIASHA